MRLNLPSAKRINHYSLINFNSQRKQGAEMAINKVGVLGCGLMGSGIAQVAATSGYPTIVKEVADEFLKKGMAGIEKSLGRFVEKGTLTAEQRNETMARLKGTTKF